MSSTPKTLFIAVFCLGLSASWLSAEQSSTVTEQPVESVSPVGYFGIMYTGGVPIVALNDTASHMTAWLREGERFGPYRVRAISDSKVTLRHVQSGEDLIVPMSGKVLSSGDSNDEEAPIVHTKAWINSNENPMLRSPTQLPMDLLLGWADLPDDEKIKLMDYYLAHGWKLRATETVGSANTFVWENIYEKERSAALTNQRKAFEGMLDETQLKEWKSISSGPVMKDLMQLSPEERKLMAENYKEKVDRFRADLTPDQLESMNTMNDFTRADWN